MKKIQLLLCMFANFFISLHSAEIPWDPIKEWTEAEQESSDKLMLAIQQKQAYFAEKYPDANEKLIQFTDQNMQLLLMPLPEDFREYEDAYYKTLAQEIVAHQDGTPNERRKDTLKNYIYYVIHPDKLRSSTVIVAYGVRFLIFAKTLGMSLKDFKNLDTIHDIYIADWPNATLHPQESPAQLAGNPTEHLFNRMTNIIYKHLPSSGILTPEELQTRINQISFEDFKQFSTHLSSDEQELLRELTGVYKIHLNPDDEFADYIALKMIHLRATNKDFFEQNRLIFKIKIVGSDERREAFAPFIIIYTYGKQTAQKTLDFIYDKFKNNTKMACDWAPAFNQEVTALIYFAQGDRDYKFKFGQFFEQPNLVYYKTGLTTDLAGNPEDYHLINPATKK